MHLDKIDRNIAPNTIVLDDFNLDTEMQFRVDYSHIMLAHKGPAHTTSDSLHLYTYSEVFMWWFLTELCLYIGIMRIH